MINIDVNGVGGVNVDGAWGTAGTLSKTSQLSLLSAQSFTTMLSHAFSETLANFGIDPASVKFTVVDQPSQTPATSQTPDAGQTASTAANLLAPASTVVNFLPPSGPPTEPSGSATWYADTPADDVYWSQQPAAVQQLRGIDNLDERKQLGEQLANEGYSIDVPIMIWGWDAGKVTAAREGYGYTWVPSALQQPVSAAPGVTGGGVIPYDASNPPSGSIQV